MSSLILFLIVVACAVQKPVCWAELGHSHEMPSGNTLHFSKRQLGSFPLLDKALSSRKMPVKKLDEGYQELRCRVPRLGIVDYPIVEPTPTDERTYNEILVRIRRFHSNQAEQCLSNTIAHLLAVARQTEDSAASQLVLLEAALLARKHGLNDAAESCFELAMKSRTLIEPADCQNIHALYVLGVSENGGVYRNWCLAKLNRLETKFVGGL